MTRHDYDNKFKKYAKETLSSQQINNLLDSVWSLDQKSNTDTIFKPLIAQSIHPKGVQ